MYIYSSLSSGLSCIPRTLWSLTCKYLPMRWKHCTGEHQNMRMWKDLMKVVYIASANALNNQDTETQQKHVQIQCFDRPDLSSLLPRLATNPSRWLVYMYHFEFRITVYSDVVLITAYNGQLVVIKFNDIRWSVFFCCVYVSYWWWLYLPSICANRSGQPIQQGSHSNSKWDSSIWLCIIVNFTAYDKK